jgi:hypothetical protein
MPVQRKGFLFKHFEKIVCGVVGVILVLSVVYLVKRTSGERVENLTGRIDSLSTQLRGQMDEPPPEQQVSDYVARWREARSVSEPGEVRGLFWYPWPIYYEGKRLAVNEEYVLQFREPLAPESVRVEDEDPRGQVIQRWIHPVGMDYSRVRVFTGEVELGSAMIVGEVGQRLHKMTVVVDETVRERAEPPLNVAAKAERGGIVVSFERNEANEEGVVVEAYEVFRKRARDVTGQFVLVGNVSVKTRTEEEGRTASAERGPRAAGGPGYGRGCPAGRPRREGPTGEEEETEEEQGLYSWTDNSEDRTVGERTISGIKPEETYLYKVRTVASESEPRTSEFSPLVRATALPTVDFKFTGQRGDQLRFKVIVYTDGRVYEKETTNMVGDQIGTFDSESNNVQNYLTGCYLIEFHRDAIRRQPFARSRIVYVDRQGRVRTRWRNETVVEDLWEWEPEERPSDRTGPRRGPGPGEPPGPGIPILRPNR